MDFKYQIIEEGIIRTFQSLVKALPYVLKSDKIPHNQVYRSINMSRSTWERRLKNNSFSADEMLRIAKVVNSFYELGKRK